MKLYQYTLIMYPAIYGEWEECTAQKIEFSIKDFFRKWDQVRQKRRIWSYLLKKPLMENFIFCTVVTALIKSKSDNEVRGTSIKVPMTGRMVGAMAH